MSASAENTREVSSSEEIEISPAAIGAYGRLLGAVGRRIYTYATQDGGLICEDRTSRARPTMWRILCDGEILPDRPYDYLLAGFVAGELPTEPGVTIHTFGGSLAASRISESRH
jgi:hypothetical protein